MFYVQILPPEYQIVAPSQNGLCKYVNSILTACKVNPLTT